MSQRMSQVLQHILTATIASTATGCGGLDVDDFQTVACTPEERPSLLGQLSLTRSADFLALYETGEFLDGVQLVQEIGDACATASDLATCQTAIAEATSPTGFRLGQCVQVCSEYFLIVNSGDQVDVITDDAGLAEILGEIDAPSEAVMRVMNEGYQVACENQERGGVLDTGDGYEVIATKLTASCDPVETSRYQLAVARDGSVSILDSEVLESEDGVCVGRRPGGLQAQRARGRSALGAYFGSVAHLEAAAIFAFDHLRRELEHHGAPAHLLAATERARRDEVRHARIMRRVAHRFGGTMPRPRVSPEPVRSLEEIALDNAVEGCVRETFGALVGMWQSRFAHDASVRTAMAEVSHDETQHAALSWEIDRWLMSKLDADARRRVDEARAEALASLEHEIPHDDEPELLEGAGLPSSSAHRELARQFVAGVAAMG